ncbi:Transcription initiation factor TFIID subunit 7 [Danaus plexippus plexippus]|uniref:Transcription initiation factor TFIID subunit 7 n=1 Tax=Danaus plexippus plexippus TaxID=278856 RepID=A0A212FDT1_DANPL|nr:Transcription initiation factor TFIID subunit 7 [Danaus plexippus plexippus]
MNRDKREPEYPAELESQFILRLPEDPAKELRELLKTGDNIKSRLTIQIDNDMRNGEMMICKEEADQTPAEEESPSKNKKKDPYKVDKKFLWPHGVTPPTKNVRKRRFRKTLKKKYVEAPEIEKEVKRLLRADNEAVSVTWEVVKEEDDQLKPEPVTPTPTPKAEKKTKAAERAAKKAAAAAAAAASAAAAAASANNSESSNVVDIFGSAVSDSDAEDDNINVELEDSHFSTYDSRLSDNSSVLGLGDMQTKKESYPIEFDSQMFQSGQSHKRSNRSRATTPATSTVTKSGGLSSEEDGEYSRDMSKDNMSVRIEELRTELEELKQRKQRMQYEIAGMENLALRQRFQEILHTLNQDVMYKEMEYQGLITLQNSEDI